MDESKLNGVGVIKRTKDGSVDRVHIQKRSRFQDPCPNIGPAVAIYYDRTAVKNGIEYCKRENIEKPIFYILTCRIGPFIGSLVKEIKKIGGAYYLNPGWT